MASVAEIQHKIDGLEAKLRWPNLPKHIAKGYEAQITALKKLLNQAPFSGG